MCVCVSVYPPVQSDPASGPLSCSSPIPILPYLATSRTITDLFCCPPGSSTNNNELFDSSSGGVGHEQHCTHQ